MNFEGQIPSLTASIHQTEYFKDVPPESLSSVGSDSTRTLHLQPTGYYKNFLKRSWEECDILAEYMENYLTRGRHQHGQEWYEERYDFFRKQRGQIQHKWYHHID